MRATWVPWLRVQRLPTPKTPEEAIFCDCRWQTWSYAVPRRSRVGFWWRQFFRHLKKKVLMAQKMQRVTKECTSSFKIWPFVVSMLDYVRFLGGTCFSFPPTGDWYFCEQQHGCKPHPDESALIWFLQTGLYIYRAYGKRLGLDCHEPNKGMFTKQVLNQDFILHSYFSLSFLHLLNRIYDSVVSRHYKFI